MANARDVELDIVGRDRTRGATNSAGRNLDELGRRMDQAGRQGRTMGQRIRDGAAKFAPAAQAIGAGLALLAGDAIKNAANAEQSIGATQTVFGKYADSIIAKSKNERDNVRLTADEYRNSANLIGATFKNQGVASDKLSGKTQEMIQVGADLAATYGGSTKDAVEALGGAFKGEFDPLDRYGLGINAAAVEAEQLRMKAQGVKGAMTDQGKQTAITNLIMGQAKDALGQAGRESKTTAAQTEALKEKYGNLSADLGAKLLPIVNKVLSAGVKVLDWMTKNKPVVMALAAGVGVLAGAILLMNLAFLASPFGLVALGIAALVAGLVLLWQKSQTARNIMTAAFVGIANVVLTNGRIMMQVYKAILNAVLSMVSGVLRALGKIPGNDWADRAADDVDAFKEAANKGFDKAIQKTKDWQTAVNKMPKVVKLKGEISDLNAKINAAKARLKEPGLTRPEKTKIRADIAALQERVRAAKASLAGLRDKTVKVKFSFYQVGKAPGSYGNGLGVNLDATNAWGLTEGGAGYRSGGPAPVQMGDTIVDSRIYLDGSILDSRTNTIVREHSDRSAYRARIGRR